MCLEVMTIQKGYHCPPCRLHMDCRPEDGAAHSATTVRKDFTWEVPFGLTLEGYIGVCQVWGEKLGRQRKKR